MVWISMVEKKCKNHIDVDFLHFLAHVEETLGRRRKLNLKLLR